MRSSETARRRFSSSADFGVFDILPIDEADADAVDFTPTLLMDEETGELLLGLRRGLSLLELLCEGETGLA